MELADQREHGALQEGPQGKTGSLHICRCRPSSGGIAGGTRSDAMRSRSLATYHRCVVQLNGAEDKSHRDDQPPSR